MASKSYLSSLSSLVFVAVLFLAWAGLLSAATTTPSSTSAAAPEPSATLSVADASSKSTKCGFIGDDNIYGLGIRLGVYLQWLTSSLAYNFVPEEAVTLRGVNTCFTLANFAGLLYITFSDYKQSTGGVYAVEVWIVISFCLGGAFSGHTSSNDDNSSNPVTFAGYKASAIGGIISSAVSVAVIFYTIWFLYVGMDGMLAPPCSRTAFFFTKVDLYHWFRVFLKVTFTIVAVFAGLVFVIMLLVCFPIAMYQTGPLGFVKILLGIHPDEEEEPQGDDKKIHLRNVGFSFTPLATLILGTELLIRWNHISNVTTIRGTGQLLPVIVAGGGLVRVFWKFLINLVSGRYTFRPRS